MSREQLTEVTHEAFCKRIGVSLAHRKRLPHSPVTCSATYFFDCEGEILAQIQYHYSPIDGSIRATHYVVTRTVESAEEGASIWL